MYYGHYDDNGKYIGFYTPEIHGDNIPTPNIQLTEAEWQEALTGQYKVVDSKHTYVEPEPPTLDALKATAWARIKSTRDRLEQSGVPYMGKSLDSDTLSVQRISIAVQAAQAAMAAGVEFALPWTMQDNTVLTMTAAEVMGMSVALAQYSGMLHEIARGLRERIDAAETSEELEAIAWPTEED